jgi:L-ascorbate metabolism protein UlaG (beta-lactamase superfamily)
VSRTAWLWDRISEGYFRQVAPAPKIPNPAKWRDDRLTVAWLGHSTLLVNFFGLWLITDPALLMRVGVRAGMVTLGPKRLVAPALRTRQLPPLDFILLTHAHMDHFDLGTLRRLSRRATVITAKSTSDLLPRRFRDVVELTWGESRTFHRPRGTLKVEAVRVRHWGARIRTDTHRGFNGYVVERSGRRLFLAGDTARTDMRGVGRKGPIDVMAVPIGAYDPWIMSHCSPEEAVAMANEARARYVVPIHHQTFRLGREPIYEPIRRFRNALEPDRVALTEVGETFQLPG